MGIQVQRNGTPSSVVLSRPLGHPEALVSTWEDSPAGEVDAFRDFYGEDGPFIPMALGTVALPPGKKDHCARFASFLLSSFIIHTQTVGAAHIGLTQGWDSPRAHAKYDLLANFFGITSVIEGVYWLGKKLPPKIRPDLFFPPLERFPVTYRLWTLPGLKKLVVEIWDECGKPGNGLAEKVKEKVDGWRASSKPPVPVSSFQETEEGFQSSLPYFLPIPLPTSPPLHEKAAQQVTLWGLLLFVGAVLIKNALILGSPARALILGIQPQNFHDMNQA